MRHPEGSRFDRRLRARQEERRLAEEEPIAEERRQRNRRANSMTPDEVQDWLKRNGILGGDRRKGERRHR